jgi:hypothetical protein
MVKLRKINIALILFSIVSSTIQQENPPALDGITKQDKFPNLFYSFSIERSSGNPEIPISNLINNYQLSHQLTTNNENLLSNLRGKDVLLI